MASSTPVSRLLDRVSCPICMEIYSYDAHVPKILPCEHTFCLDCLNNLSVSVEKMDEVECPICRNKHAAPSRGFTTNRTALDIIDEMEKGASAPPTKLRCSDHNDDECVLVCINCVTGLCLKCVKQKTHQGHDLEELLDALDLLKPMFEEQIEIEKAALDRRKRDMPYPISELNKAESNITKMCDEAVKLITSWKKEQLLKIRDFKQLAVTWEDEHQVERGLLQSFSEQSNVDIGTMIARLKYDEAQKKLSVDHTGYTDYIEAVNKYNFQEQTESLRTRLQSVWSCQEFLTSMVLNKQAFEGGPKSRATFVSQPAITKQRDRDRKLYYTSDTATVDMKSQASLNAKTPTSMQASIQSSDDTRKCVIKKVAYSEGELIGHFNDHDVVVYSCDSGACKYSDKSRLPVMQAVTFYICEDVQFNPNYRERIEKMKEFYLSR